MASYDPMGRRQTLVQLNDAFFASLTRRDFADLSRIVEQTCNEYGVRYAVHPTFMAGVRSHYRWLKRMGQAPTAETGTPAVSDAELPVTA